MASFRNLKDVSADFCSAAARDMRSSLPGSQERILLSRGLLLLVGQVLAGVLELGLCVCDVLRGDLAGPRLAEQVRRNVRRLDALGHVGVHLIALGVDHGVGDDEPEAHASGCSGPYKACLTQLAGNTPPPAALTAPVRLPLAPTPELIAPSAALMLSPIFAAKMSLVSAAAMMAPIPASGLSAKSLR